MHEFFWMIWCLETGIKIKRNHFSLRWLPAKQVNWIISCLDY
jgi:hypothetical protein